MKRYKPLPLLADRIRILVKAHPKAAEWTSDALAEHLGVNPSSIKRNVAWQEMRADALGVELIGSDLKILAALHVLTSDGTQATSKDVAKEAKMSVTWTAWHLSGLAARGYASSRIGDKGGYQVTAKGSKALRKSQPRQKRR